MGGIAIVGLAGRFPSSPTLDAYWENLREGRECVHFYSDEELAGFGLDAPALRAAGHIPARPRLDDVEMFDHAFFGYTKEEAEGLDPQQRIFLEMCWEALEDAGRNPRAAGGLVGVFAGANISNYLIFNLRGAGGLNPARFFASMISNTPDFLTSRVAFHLDARGPVVSVQAACATGLVAVHLACQSLLDFACDTALAGAVSLQTIPYPGYINDGRSMFSPDGHTRVFDARAQGTVFGEGAGVVVLRRLEDALADGDHILGVVRGTAMNNSGRVPAGFSSPDVRAQEEVATEALATAGVTADTISYVEAHGSGTTIGDTIELTALGRAFRHTTDKRGFCGIGSVKSNVGHLAGAAGLAALVKVLLALRHQVLPPSIHIDTPNPALPLDGSPFRLQRTATPWTGPFPRRASVHSFAIGGSNAHLVLEEAPARPVRPADVRPHLLVLSARTAPALAAQAAALVARLEGEPGLDLGDVAFTLARGRDEFLHRVFVVARDVREAAARLRDRQAGSSGEGVVVDVSVLPPVAAASLTVEQLATVGSAWVAGRSIDWTPMFAGLTPRRVPLPTYPFERVACWVPFVTSGGGVDLDTGRGATAPAATVPALPREAGAAPRTTLEQHIASTWSATLGGITVGLDDNYFELGGTSLQLADAHQKLVASGHDVSVVDVFTWPTVRTLAACIDAQRQGTPLATSGLAPGAGRLTEADLAILRADAVLPDDVRPVAGEPVSPPAHVLLTGATGFLGTFLLKELLRQTSATIHCHVRAATPDAGSSRIRAALQAHGLWDEADAPRIVPVCGDLGLPRLGLSEAHHAELARTIDAIYHNGAMVNFTHPYAKLKAANVTGTLDALRLACEGRPKAFHLVSSVGVWANRFPVAEDDPLEDIATLENGYTQSKWVAERLVAAAADRGLRTGIYRPPRIVGDTERGVTNLDDFVARVIKGCAELGMAPTGHFFDIMAPADFVARAVVFLSLQPEVFARRVFHLVHKRLTTWRTILDYMREAGLPLEPVSYDTWRAALVARCETGDNALKPLLPLFRPQTEDARAQPPVDFEVDWSQMPEVPCANTEALLAGSGIACPLVDRALLDVQFGYFFDKGFLERPTRRG